MQVSEAGRPLTAEVRVANGRIDPWRKDFQDVVDALSSDF
jgi:hypothetical protein